MAQNVTQYRHVCKSQTTFGPPVVRITDFRVDFIQLLLRKTVTQAEQFERTMFGWKQIVVVTTAEQGESRK